MTTNATAIEATQARLRKAGFSVTETVTITMALADRLDYLNRIGISGNVRKNVTDLIGE